MSFRALLGRFQSRNQQRTKRVKAARPYLEALEDRTVPSVSFNISTGFDNSSNTLLSALATDSDYVVTDTSGATYVPKVQTQGDGVLPSSYVGDTALPGSRWLMPVNSSGAYSAASGNLRFQTQVDLTGFAAAEAQIQDLQVSADNGFVSVAVNGAIVYSRDPGRTPEDFGSVLSLGNVGLGSFQPDINSIEFTVFNAGFGFGTGPSPAALRVQASVVTQVSAVPTTLLALDSATNAIVRFDGATPGTITTTAIGGLNNGETVLGIDFRPSNGLLYGITNLNRLLTINPVTAAATAAAVLTADPTDATSPFTALSGSEFGVDFNPVPDRLRVVSDTNQNLRINPNNGFVITDTDINPGTPDVVASAYLNSFAGTTGTTLYGIDAAANRLVIQNPPNDGTLATVGTNLGTGIDATLATGFDIVTTGGPSSRVNTGFATLVASGVNGLYTVNLTTGIASLVGTIGTGTTPFSGLAVVPAGTLNFSVESYVQNENGFNATLNVTRTGGSLGIVSVDYETASGSATADADYTASGATIIFADGETTPQIINIVILDDQISEGNEILTVALSDATNGVVIGPRGSAILSIRDNETPSILLYGVTPTNAVVEFSSETPGVIRRTTPITNLVAGDVIKGIDFRPANNQLYALVVNGTTSRLVTLNLRLGLAYPVGNLSADPSDASNPFTTLAGTDFGFDFNPVPDRIRIVSNSSINLSVNPANGFVTTQTDINSGTPNVVGSAYTNSFAGAGSTTLYAIDSGNDSLYSQNPPANGTLTLVGALGVDTTGQTGFEIASANNQAFATLTSPGAVASLLFSVDLDSGETGAIGAIGGGTTINGLTSQQVNDINYSENERFVNRLFRDFFGRNAEDAGRVAFTDLLNKGWSRDQVAKEIMKSPEYRGLVVEELYRKYLNRASDAGGKAGFVDLLGSGHTVEEVTAIIVGSAEYFQINGGTNTQFLAAPYQDVLGRPIDANGQASFLSALESGVPRQTVASWILGSQEYHTKLVTSFYTYYLLRNPDAGGLAAHIGFLQAGASSNDVLAGILGSGEYFARTQ